MTTTTSAVEQIKGQALAVQAAIEGQRVCRVGVEAMISAGGNSFSNEAYIGAHAMVLAHAARMMVMACGCTHEAALQALVMCARASLAGGLGPWTNVEKGLG